ncbi:MAG: hypothetical protein AB8B59_17015 [Maribacter sp.]
MKTKMILKTRIIFCVTIIFVFASSCSKIVEEIIEKNESKTEDILVEESPWVFSRYEISSIEDDGESGLSSQEIENDLNQYLIDVSFTFNVDGTGYRDIPNQDREDWVWTLSEDRLITISDSKTDRYTFFSADQNQMTFEGRTSTGHTRDSVQYMVTHVGKYFFN